MTSILAVRGLEGAARPSLRQVRLSGLLPAGITLLVCSLTITGCASYHPAPRTVGGIADHFSAKAVSWPMAAQTCRRLAPAAACDPERPDRLMLFAMLLGSNPDVASARAHLRSAEAAAAAARTPSGPSLTLSTEYARASSDPSPWLFGAALDIPLDIGGRRSARIAGADLAVSSARYDLLEAIWTARMELVRALDELFVGSRQQEIAAELVVLENRRIQAMERRVAGGEATRAELERARNDLADARRRKAAATATREGGKARLAKALGLPAANLPATLVDGGAIVPTLSGTAPDQQARSQALLARPDLLKSMIAYDQAEIDLRAEIAKQYPAISIGPGFTWERGLVKLPFNIGLALPPLDLNRRNIRAAEARRSEAGAALEATYAAAAGSVDIAYAEMLAAQQALAELRRLDLPIAQRLALQADREIDAGAIDRTDWTAAKAGLLIARLAEADALARVLAATAALEDALRRPLSGPETLIEGNAR